MGLLVGWVKLILKNVVAPVVLLLTVVIGICVGLVQCIRLGVGASQHGDRPVGRSGFGDILPAKRPNSAGDCVTYQPVWTALAGHLASRQSAGFDVCNTGFGL